MNNQLPEILSIMYIGDESGCQEVPDPICPRFMMLPDSNGPIRTPIPASDITSSGPMFMFIPPMFIPGICLLGLADGLAEGIGMFIPGMFVSCCGDA